MKNTKDGVSKVHLFFGVMISLIFAIILGALLFYPIPQENRSAVDILLGSISFIQGMVYTYFFGSSQGSYRKTDMLHRSYPMKPEEDDEPQPPKSKRKYEEDDEYKR